MVSPNEALSKKLYPVPFHYLCLAFSYRCYLLTTSCQHFEFARTLLHFFCIHIPQQLQMIEFVAPTSDISVNSNLNWNWKQLIQLTKTVTGNILWTETEWKLITKSKNWIVTVSTKKVRIEKVQHSVNKNI